MYRGLVYRLGTHQSASYTNVAGVISNAFGAGTRAVRVVLTTAGFVKFGTAPTAATTDIYLPADTPAYFVVNPGEKVSAVRLTSSGTVHVTELSG